MSSEANLRQDQNRFTKPSTANKSIEKYEEMIDDMPSNFFLVDKDEKIIFINKFAKKALNDFESALDKAFGLRPQDMIGTSLRHLTKSGRKELDQYFENSGLDIYETLFEIDDVKLKAAIKAIPDDEDEKIITYAVHWDKQTGDDNNQISSEVVFSMLEYSPINTMYANTDLVIKYMNPTSLRTLKSLEQYLPVKADDIVGSNVDIFHKNPQYQRGILSNPNNLPVETKITLGPEILNLLVVPIMDKNNNYLGPMVSWEVITEKVKLEKEMDRINCMMENSPINTMYADKDFVVRYMNPASLKTLKTLEQYLPIKAEECVGQCIDIFHKNPAHQRSILSNPNNLPYKARIEVGPEILDLLTTAIVDQDNNYLGPMITWEVITEKVKLEREMDRVNCMMENSPINTMYADKDFIVRYMNPASLKTLKTLEQYLPIKAEECVGQCIDIFHKNPAHQRAILSNPNNLPYKARIQVGPETLDLLTTAIVDQNNNYLGPMITWEVVTEKVKLELEMSRVSCMMENSPINTIYADNDFTIRYMNPASLTTLKSLEQYLPVRVEEVIGQSVDIFHKNPAHQRKILSDPKNLPYNARIGLGPETLDLLVSPITDKDGKYLGPMVTWEVVTEKLANENKVKELADLDRNQKLELQNKIDQLLEVVHASSQGDLTKEVPFTGEDACGKMAAGLQTLLGNLNQRIAAIDNMAQTLNASAENLTAISSTMKKDAEETSQKADYVAKQSEEVGENLQTVATGTEELNASVGEINKSVNYVVKVSENATKLTDNANITIDQLGNSSNEIGEVIKMITSIAQQTNLLALNATIEAAQAGDAGRGFAVVANEVKELAKETAQATETISKKIKTIQENVGGTIEAIKNISETIGEIRDTQNNIASAVEEQSITTRDIGKNVSDGAKGSTTISSSMVDVAAKAKATNEGAEQTSEAAVDLNKIGKELSELVSQFIYKKQ